MNTETLSPDELPISTDSAPSLLPARMEYSACAQPASSAHTRDALRWQPTHSSFLEDLENIQP